MGDFLVSGINKEGSAILSVVWGREEGQPEFSLGQAEVQPPAGCPWRDIQWAFGQMVLRAMDGDLGRIHACVSHSLKAVTEAAGWERSPRRSVEHE